jgi:hypothetical protein
VDGAGLITRSEPESKVGGSKARLKRPAITSLVVAGLAALVLFAPIKWPCPMATLFGIPCPTCGMTRAARLALHGDFSGATHMHPLWMIVLPALVIAFVIEVAGAVRTGAWGAASTSLWAKRITPVIVALLVVVWLARFLGAFGGPVPVR